MPSGSAGAGAAVDGVAGGAEDGAEVGRVAAAWDAGSGPLGRARESAGGSCVGTAAAGREADASRVPAAGMRLGMGAAAGRAGASAIVAGTGAGAAGVALTGSVVPAGVVASTAEVLPDSAA